MITENELRAGNYIECFGIHKIKYLIERGIHFEDGSGCNFNAAYPIPLTEEWLIKFGFEEVDNKSIFDYPLWIINDVEFLFQADSTFIFNSVAGNFPIHFIHQLQNLYFVLTGKELAI